MSADIVDLDNRILIDEVTQNMTEVAGIPFGVPGEPLGIKLQYWSPERAADEFTAAFHRYGGR